MFLSWDCPKKGDNLLIGYETNLCTMNIELIHYRGLNDGPLDYQNDGPTGTCSWKGYYDFSQKPHTLLLEEESIKRFIYCQNNF